MLKDDDADTDDRNALPPGTAIDEYVLERVLGSGGFGITYRARDQFGRYVAIKEYLPIDLAVRETDLTVHPRSSRERETYGWGLARFWDEAQTLAMFKHPNIVRVIRYFAAHNTAYMVMDYEEGVKFTDLLARHEVLSEHELWKLLDPLLGGLEHMHRAGVLHRDIKPDNIYVRADGSPLLLDFGAARQALSSRSRNLTAVLTPPYAPIEQYGSHFPQGPWTDIYSLGAVIYEALSGKKPPPSTDRHLGAPMTPLSEAAKQRCSPHLLAGVDAALSVKGQDRPQNVPQWLRILKPSGAAIGKDVPVLEAPIQAPAGNGTTDDWYLPVFAALAFIFLIGIGINLVVSTPESRFNRAQTADKSGNIQQAIDDYSRAIAGLPPEQSAMAHLNRGRDYESSGPWHDIDSAIRDFEAASSSGLSTEADPYLGAAYATKASELDGRGKLDDAIQFYTRALGRLPQSAGIYLARARVYKKKAQYKEAFDDAAAAIKLKPGSDAYELRGDLYAETKRPDQAISDYTKAIGLDAGALYAYQRRGDISMDKGLWDRAVADYGKAIQLDANDPRLYDGRARALGEKGLLDQAIADFTKAIELAPNQSMVFSNRASAYLRKGAFIEARQDVTTALELDANNPYAYFNRAALFVDIHDNASAIADYKKALSLNPPQQIKKLAEERLRGLGTNP